MIGIAASSRDAAGSNVHKRILELARTEEDGTFEGSPVRRGDGFLLVLTERELLHAGHLDGSFSVERWLFASRHKAASGIPTLTAHSPGNWTSSAEHGGEPCSLSRSDPCLIKAALVALKRRRDAAGIPYELSLEVTHHGPTSLERPVVFVEIGSGPAQWEDPLAVDVAARAILDAVALGRPHGLRTAVGFGGGHYPRHFTELALSTDIAIGHIMPKYVSESVDLGMVASAVERNGPTDLALVDWKGLSGPVRSAVVAELGRIGVPVLKAQEAKSGAGGPGY